MHQITLLHLLFQENESSKCSCVVPQRVLSGCFYSGYVNVSSFIIKNPVLLLLILRNCHICSEKKNQFYIQIRVTCIFNNKNFLSATVSGTDMNKNIKQNLISSEVRSYPWNYTVELLHQSFFLSTVFQVLFRIILLQFYII